MRKNAGVHADDPGDGVNFRKKLVKLLRRNDPILGPRVTKDRVLIKLLVNVQDRLRLVALGRQPGGQRGEVQKLRRAGGLLFAAVQDHGRAVINLGHLVLG